MYTHTNNVVINFKKLLAYIPYAKSFLQGQGQGHEPNVHKT